MGRSLTAPHWLHYGSPGAGSGVGSELRGARARRAAGMGGAFVAVADDASAPSTGTRPASRTAARISAWSSTTTRARPSRKTSARPAALGEPHRATTLPVGLSYYRSPPSTVDAHDRSADRPAGPPDAPIAGVTLVQSLTERLAVGATLKWVRDTPPAASCPTGTATTFSTARAICRTCPRTSSTRTSASWRRSARFKAGLTVRNLAEPDFRRPAAEPLTLEAADTGRGRVCRACRD